MNTCKELKQWLENLTGQQAPIDSELPQHSVETLGSRTGLGFSQLNELLLFLGLDRINRAFFQYLVDRETKYSDGSAIRTIKEFKKGVNDFRRLGLLFYGNVKFAFKKLSRSRRELEKCIELIKPISDSHFHNRHKPIIPVEEIPAKQTFFLGYTIAEEIAEEIKKRLKKNPNDKQAKEEESLLEEVVKKGTRNHAAYLAYEYLDVYVATSMRLRHEYLAVNRLCRQIFGHEKLKPLNLRWFDPTQAYCKDRIDKGLSEALMLKMAQCTIYLAQETDTLGKDSELASTLAQGKAVIAFVPKGNEDYVRELLEDLKELYPDKTEGDLIMEQLRIFDPKLAWNEKDIRGWIEKPETIDVVKAKRLLVKTVKDHYDRRAKTLHEIHPLAIQVHLASGVANGVLVVRAVDHCVDLIRCVITRNMKFELDPKNGTVNNYLCLKETTSDSVYRVMTDNVMLTNTFWNFYPT